MMEDQNGLCIICQTECSRTKRPAKLRQNDSGFVTRLSVDHDHETGKVRGLICHLCNIGLGSFHDDPELLENAAKYIRNCQ